MRLAGGTRDLTVLLTVCALMVVLTVVSGLVAPPQPEAGDPGSSYAPGPEGAKAAFVLLKRLGYDAVRSLEPLSSLGDDPTRSLLVLAAPSESPSRQDQLALRRFVEAGGTVLATGPTAAVFLPDATAVGTGDEKTEVRSFSPVWPSPLARNVPRIEMRTSSPLPVWPAPYVTVYANESGPGILIATFGHGRAIWWAGSDPLTNKAIASGSHLVLLLNALGAPGLRPA